MTALPDAWAMRGDDSTLVNGWQVLYVDFPGGRRLSLRDAYDSRQWPSAR